MMSLYTRALLLLRRSPCWNKHRAARTTRHVTTRLARRVMLVVSWHDATSEICCYKACNSNVGHPYSLSFLFTVSLGKNVFCSNQIYDWVSQRSKPLSTYKQESIVELYFNFYRNPTMRLDFSSYLSSSSASRISRGLPTTGTSSSKEWSLDKLPSSFVSRHASTVWGIVRVSATGALVQVLLGAISFYRRHQILV